MSETTDDGRNYIERVEHWHSKVPDGYRDEYNQLLSDGVAPERACAAVVYVAGQRGDAELRMQKEIVSEHDISGPTLRKYTEKIAPSVAGKTKRTPKQPSRGSAGSDSSTEPNYPVTTAARKTFYVLYAAEQPFMTLSEIIERVGDYSSHTVRNRIRTLIDKECVGSMWENAHKKLYWAVPRHDTPEFRDENRQDWPTNNELIKGIAKERDWESGYDGECKLTERTYGTPEIQSAGWLDITGTESTWEQIEVLKEEYGLEPGDDFNVSVSFSVKNSGLQILHQQLAGGSGGEGDD